MDFQTLNNGTCFCFHGPVNIGYVLNKDNGMLIDAGIDAGTMKKVLKELEKRDLPITHLLITHAHSDHYGGAAYLQSKHQVWTIAPALEEAILRNPILEPLYLFGGNDPLSELRNKFLEGEPIKVDEVISEGEWKFDELSFYAYSLPGHSYNQLGILVDHVLFATDSYFSTEQLHKHGIPYLTDAAAAIASLHKLKGIPCDGAIPGHGEFETDFLTTIEENIRYHEHLMDWLAERVSRTSAGISHETIIAEMCEAFQVKTPRLSQWLLYRTAVTAYLTGLLRQDRIISSIEGYRWIFKSKS